MKTKINHLLGGVRPVLVTFGFTQSPAALARILIIGLAFLVAVPSEAAGGGGSGGGGTGGGTIYFIGPWAGDTQGGTAVMTSMDSDGSGKTELGHKMFGNPSTALHGGRRWFIYTYMFSGQYYPDGITRRSEVFALREDFDPYLNNNANTVVQLTDDITLQPGVGTTDWVPGGARISFKGRRWASTEPGATVVEGGIYTASLVFGANGNIVGLAEQPATPAIPFPLVETTPGEPWPALAGYCWAPTGNLVAYQNTLSELWVADLLNTHIRIRIGQARTPQWSPDGSLIMFSDKNGIYTTKPNGTGSKLIIPTTSTWLFLDAYFSPTGTHIVYTGSEKTRSNGDVFRATVKGGNQVNLTKTSAPLSEHTNPYGGAGWR